MSVYTTEIASDQIPSDNPIHQRLLKAYHVAIPFIQGDLLELGCGEGRGVELLAPKATSYLGLDKIQGVIDHLSEKYPQYQFESSVFPPFKLPDNSFDTIVTFQVIEHIKEDALFLEEIHRVLKPGGTALISTPNNKQTLSRNPWHEREYIAEELTALASKYFDHVEMKGIGMSERMTEYHEQNRVSVNKIMRWDVLDLQHRLPAALLRLPYEFLNRRNRNKLQNQSNDLVLSINQDDFYLNDVDDQNVDLFLIVKK
ncbi:class I SAM-dependent methyltransferase [Marinoscillum sp. MHG1-6]|uniref:class I SAM-dependent methyltransferase n=1 Tax=Marinoscillum sp. MHG1-6 TaxID=2959627 RepID=UPI002157B0C2|nr:class I SAM-dependent methyltransferase [Marinoscillum sp. MHG1-6]